VHYLIIYNTCIFAIVTNTKIHQAVNTIHTNTAGIIIVLRVDEPYYTFTLTAQLVVIN
jgi:hypothetical protein